MTEMSLHQKNRLVEVPGLHKIDPDWYCFTKFENQINKAITSCFFFYAVKPRVVYSTRVMLPSAKKIAFLPLR